MSVHDNITSSRFQTGTFTVTRTATGTTTKGRYTPGADSTFPIDAVVRPVTGQLLVALPEGQHAENTRVFYTKTEVRERTDVIAMDSEDWAVFQADDFPGHGGRHYRVMASRKDLP